MQVFDGRPPNAPAVPDVIALMADRTEPDGEEDQGRGELGAQELPGGGESKLHSSLKSWREQAGAGPTQGRPDPVLRYPD